MNKFFEALALVASEIEDPEKNKKVRSGRIQWEYADLPSILKAVRPVCAKHGISIMQSPSVIDKQLHIKTVVRYKDGSHITEESTWPCETKDVQKIGGLITYYRKYGLQAALNISGDDDQDDMSRHEENNKNQNFQTKKQANIVKEVENNLKNIATKKLKDYISLHGQEVVKSFVETNHNSWRDSQEETKKLIDSLDNGDCDAFRDQYHEAMGSNYVPF